MVPRPHKRRRDDVGEDDEGETVDLGAAEHAWWAQRPTEQVWAPRSQPPVDDQARDILADHFGADWRTSFGFGPLPAAAERPTPEPAPERQQDPVQPPSLPGRTTRTSCSVWTRPRRGTRSSPPTGPSRAPTTPTSWGSGRTWNVQPRRIGSARSTSPTRHCESAEDADHLPAGSLRSSLRPRVESPHPQHPADRRPEPPCPPERLRGGPGAPALVRGGPRGSGRGGRRRRPPGPTPRRPRRPASRATSPASPAQLPRAAWWRGASSPA